MSTHIFTIIFAYSSSDNPHPALLTAIVEKQKSGEVYVIRNIKAHNKNKEKQAAATDLPDLRLKMDDVKWLDANSGKPTNLSLAIGNAIEQHQARLQKN
jgi:hypothetical protein